MNIDLNKISQELNIPLGYVKSAFLTYVRNYDDISDIEKIKSFIIEEYAVHLYIQKVQELEETILYGTNEW